MVSPDFRVTAYSSYTVTGIMRHSSASAERHSSLISPRRAFCSTAKRWKVFSRLAVPRVKFTSGAGSTAAPPPSQAPQSSAARMARASEGAIYTTGLSDALCSSAA